MPRISLRLFPIIPNDSNPIQDGATTASGAGAGSGADGRPPITDVAFVLDAAKRFVEAAQDKIDSMPETRLKHAVAVCKDLVDECGGRLPEYLKLRNQDFNHILIATADVDLQIVSTGLKG